MCVPYLFFVHFTGAPCLNSRLSARAPQLGPSLQSGQSSAYKTRSIDFVPSRYVWMYIYIQVYICMFVSIYIDLYIYICIYIYIYISQLGPPLKGGQGPTHKAWSFDALIPTRYVWMYIIYVYRSISISISIILHSKADKAQLTRLDALISSSPGTYNIYIYVYV